MGQPQQFGNGRKRKLVNANIGKGPTKQCRDTILRGNQQQPSHLLDHSQRLIWSGARRNDPCDYRRDLAHTREKGVNLRQGTEYVRPRRHPIGFRERINEDHMGKVKINITTRCTYAMLTAAQGIARTSIRVGRRLEPQREVRGVKGQQTTRATLP